MQIAPFLLLSHDREGLSLPEETAQQKTESEEPRLAWLANRLRELGENPTYQSLLVQHQH